jgi:hypothetical protein
MYDEVMGKALAAAVHVDLVLAKPNGLHEMLTHVQDPADVTRQGNRGKYLLGRHADL